MTSPEHDAVPPIEDTPTPEPAPVLNESNWKDFIPEDIRGSDSLSKFTDVGALAKSYINAEKMIGKDSVVIPTTEEEFQEVYTKLGRPENFEQYEFADPENLHPLAEIDPGIQDKFLKAAHDMGLNQSQVTSFNKWYYELINSQASDAQREEEVFVEDNRNALKQVWGEKLDGNLEMVSRAITQFGGQDLLQKIESTGLAADSSFIQLMHKFTTSLTEDTGFVPNNQSQQASTESLKEEVVSLMGSPSYMNRDDPAHDMTVRKVQNLYGRIHAARG